MNNYNTTSGIYKITNTTDNKTYIGQSKMIIKRLRDHEVLLKRNGHTNSLLQRAYNKHKKFAFEIMEMCDYKDLDEKETFWINFFDSTNRKHGYNFESGGNEYKKHHPETIAKMRKSALGKNNILNKVEVKAIKQRLSEGEKYNVLAEEYDVSPTTINKIYKCVNWDWLMPELNETLLGLDIKLESKRKEVILSAYEEGMSSPEVSKITGYTVPVVQKYLKGFSAEFMNERYQDIRKDYAEGLSNEKIMKKYDVSIGVINKAIPNRHTNERKLRNKTVKEMNERGLPNNVIAELVGIHRTSVTEILLGRMDVGVELSERTPEIEAKTMELINSDVSMRKTAQKLNITRHIVKEIMNDFKATQ